MEKRSFKTIRHILLSYLTTGEKTLNQLSKASGVNWKTTENHVVHLVGKGLAAEVLFTPYARIYKITDRGLEALKKYRGKKR